MTYSLDIGGNDQTPYIRDKSITSKFNTLDLVLLDPVDPPEVGDWVDQTDPDWAGTVVKVQITDVVEKGVHTFYTISAVNSNVLVETASTFDLSDEPDGVTTFGYKELMTQTVLNLDGTFETTGRCTIFEPGMHTGKTFQLYSANHGYAGTTFTVTQTTVRWPSKEPNPEYLIEFGDGITTLGEVIHHPAPACEADTIVSPVTIYHWTFTSDELDDESSTYDIGLERTVPGGFGSNYGDSIGMGADGPYGHNDGGHFESEAIPVTAGTIYTLTADMGWHFTPSSRNVDVRWYNVTDTLISTDRLISGAGRATGTRYDGLTGNATAPVGADHAKIYWTNFAGLYADNIYWATAGSIVAAGSDPFCVVDPGESPYYARSDDPRFASLEQQIADLEANPTDIGSSLRQHMHGIYLAVGHERGSVASAPITFWSIDGKHFTTMVEFVTDNASPTYAGDPAITHWNGKWWLTHQFSTGSGRTKFTLWSSEDLEDWTEVAEVATGIAGIVEVYPGAWARNEDGSAYVDPSDGRPRFVMSATTGTVTDGPFVPYEMHPTNDAMTTWSSAAAITGNFPADMIDPFWIKHGDEWAIWYKSNDPGNEVVEYATCPTMTGAYVVQETGDWAGWGTARESPSLVKLDDGRWRIYIQKYTAQTDGIFWSESDDDWATWSALTQVTTDLTDDDTLGGLDVLFIPGVYDHQRDPDAHGAQLAGYIAVGSSPHILLADGHATPFTFNDLLQMDSGLDFMWSDPE